MKFRLIITMLLFISMGITPAADFNVPNTFYSGQTTSSSEVNANFSAIENAINYVNTNSVNVKSVVRITNTTTGNGFIETLDGSGTTLTRITSSADGGGYFNVNHSNGRELVSVGVSQDSGFITTRRNISPSQKLVSLSTNSGNIGGWLGIYNGEEDTASISLYAAKLSSGIDMYSPTSLDRNFPIFFTKSNNQGKAYSKMQSGVTGDDYIYIGTNTSGNGLICAYNIIGEEGACLIGGGTKSFITKHPEDDEKVIVYASLEGPEAAMYVRGSAQLINGKAIIELPEYFRLLAASKGMTATITPLSADSVGLARTYLAPEKLIVQELHNGTGNYNFDYMVYAVRKGHENFQVIRNKQLSSTQTSTSTSSAKRSKIIADISHTHNNNDDRGNKNENENMSSQ